VKSSKILAVVIVIVVIVIVAIAYITMSQPPAQPKKIKVAMSISGLINDPGWPHLGYLALKHVEEKLGAEIAYTEHVAYPDMERVLTDYATKGFTLIWGHGGEYDEVAAKIADSYPNTYFMTTGCRTNRPNLVAFDPRWGEMTYLAGVLSGSMTKTNKLGIILGAEFPPIIWIAEAFKLGARSVNPAVKFYYVNTGTWTDPAKGKDVALSQIDAGVDIIVTWADLTGLGAVEAAREKGIYVIAETQDHYELAKDVALGTCIVDFRGILEKTVKDIIDGTFKGETYTPGIKDGVVDFKSNEAFVPTEIQNKVNQVRGDIISGALKVPEIYEKTD
jgi:basic membrane protein A